jgi:ParB-like chromosome segregation protein Spo0J
MAALDLKLEELSAALGGLRLCPPELERDVEQSLRRHGQLTPVLARRQAPGWQLIDGFKRLRSARALSWTHLRVQPWEGDAAHAKLLLWHCNRNHGLTELEEGWVVRALHRDDGLTQPQVAQLLGRSKSWVCRRLVLVEGLSDCVQADVRLGLLSATTAREIGRLPRGNQDEAARLVSRRGLTTRQGARLVDQLLAAPDEEGWRRVLEATARETSPAPGGERRGRRPTPGEVLMTDVASATRTCTRLHARLLERPVTSFGTGTAEVVAQGLRALRPALGVLEQAIEAQLCKLERMAGS